MLIKLKNLTFQIERKTDIKKSFILFITKYSDMEYVYAGLLLRYIKKEINEENLRKILIAAGITVDEVRLKGTINLFKEVKINEQVLEETMVQQMQPKKEEKKQEEITPEKPKEEDNDDILDILGQNEEEPQEEKEEQSSKKEDNDDVLIIGDDDTED